MYLVEWLDGDGKWQAWHCLLARGFIGNPMMVFASQEQAQAFINDCTDGACCRIVKLVKEDA